MENMKFKEVNIFPINYLEIFFSSVHVLATSIRTYTTHNEIYGNYFSRETERERVCVCVYVCVCVLEREKKTKSVCVRERV